MAQEEGQPDDGNGVAIRSPGIRLYASPYHRPQTLEPRIGLFRTQA